MWIKKEPVHHSVASGAEMPRWIRGRQESCDDALDSLRRQFGHEVTVLLLEQPLVGRCLGPRRHAVNRAQPTARIEYRSGL